MLDPTTSMEPLVAGRVLENPVSGERIVIRQSGSETGGRLLEFDLFLPPGGHVPAQHAHPAQEERFTVLDGRMRFRLAGRTIVASAGESVVVPPGAPHRFGNAGQGIFERSSDSRGRLFPRRSRPLFFEIVTINDSTHEFPEANKKFCQKCGQKTIMECQQCGDPIRVDYVAGA